MEKGTLLLAAVESGLQVWKCTGCGEIAVSKPGAGRIDSACPNCETALLVVPIAVTAYNLTVEN